MSVATGRSRAGARAEMGSSVGRHGAACGSRHPFTLDPGDWCPCSEHALVERSADGETERGAWLLSLPCQQERALARAARRAGVSMEEWLANLIRVALKRAGGGA